MHESVAFLLENLPSGLRVVVSGRADPPLPSARLRARGQLAELRAADLRFTGEEAAALLREAIGADLSGPTVAALTARTEGWAAGLQLAGRRAATAPPGLAEPLTGRELEVLRLIAAGRSNQRIARDLVVALDTVKKHVTHVLGKLGAANRTEAVARARDLGLIP